MKVNPIGIQSYQQLTNRNSQPSKKVDDANLLKTNNDEKVTIKPQQIAESKIAVKAQNSSYADYLSPEEKNVLDILFNRFKDSERFGGFFQSENNTVKENNLGRTIDLKV